jgi:DNA processing protein
MQLELLVALTKVPGLGAVRIRQLLKHFGDLESLWGASKDELCALPGFGTKVVQGIGNESYMDAAKEELELADLHSIQCLAFFDSKFPLSLRKQVDGPVLLFVKGELRKQDEQSIAVIGTRHASIYGRETAVKFSRELAASGYTVVSGLARGVDTAAHCGALEGGRTIAVIGSGLLRLYPQENRALADKIVESGALISEYPLMTPPDRQNFPQRNRIVSGMTRATVLIEAPEKSGAMDTVRRAKKQGRPVFTIPGRIDQENFRGNHALLKRGEAKLVETSSDVLSHFDDLFSCPAQQKEESSTVDFDSEEMKIMKVLQEKELTIDMITQLSQLPSSRVNVLLMRLLLKNAVKEYPGKIYKKAC